MYILVVPADNADAQNPGAVSVRNTVNDAANSGEPVHFQNPAGSASTAYWGVSIGGCRRGPHQRLC